MIRPIPHILVTVVIAALVVFANADEGESENGHKIATTAKSIDPLISGLPGAVVKTYQTLFPGHRIWQSSRTGKGKATRYELTIFEPTSTWVHGIRKGSAHVRTLLNYKLILSGTGKVIREHSHPISEEAVPKVVRDAFEKWRRPFRKRSLSVEWRAYQEEGAERLYWVQVVLNAVESYGATLKADGTFVKRSTKFN